MGKKIDEINAVFEQNRLLREQNELLRKNIDILQQSQKSLSEYSSANSQVFVKDIDKDEMRNGFLVTAHKKRLWNTQIGLINEFARICKKYNLRWFADSGTLLGTIRHKGFIPWDDDVDIAMLRSDFEKFKVIAPKEVRYPYFFDPWYNYRMESDETSVDSENTLPMVTYEQQRKCIIQFPMFPLIKLRDSRTFMLEFPKRKNINQGIWIDIFPLDVAPPFEDKQQLLNFNAARELLMATFAADQIKKTMQGEHKFTVDDNSMQKFLKLSYSQRAQQLDAFLFKKFPNPGHVGYIKRFCFKMKRISYNIDEFREYKYMPFEEIELPVPVGYENILTELYGDWRKMVIERGHVSEYSVDISFDEYRKKSVFMR